MSLRTDLTFLRLCARADLTRVPRRTFRELRRRGRATAGPRAQLGGGLWSRLSALRAARRWLGGEHITRHGGRYVLNTFLPPFPSRAYDRMFENLLAPRRFSPVSAYLALTSRCEQSCWHCSAKGRPGGELDTRTWLRVIDELHGLGASVFGLTGGEPLLRDDLEELIGRVRSGGGEAILFTSGLGLSPERARSLAAAGLWAVGVSLDHPDADVVAARRGRADAFAVAVAALRTAQAAGLYTCVNAVAERGFVDAGVHVALHELGRQLGVHELRLIEPMPCGRLFHATTDALLEPVHIAELRRFHMRTNRARRLPKVCAFNQLESPELFGCSAGTRHVFVDSTGTVQPCDFVPLSFGSIVDEPLDAIWSRLLGAMGAPRQHCFAQRNHALLRETAGDGPLPLPPEASLALVAAAPPEPAPDFVRWSLGG
ncbi:MAG: radical SAM protein [Planctomycetes bacterium]|nr:radical SAM protein [Planctomycetota bacterium]